MAVKTVGFAISEEERSALDALAEHFAGGNRSEFLRIAIRRLSADLQAERLQGLQTRAHQELGRVVGPDEVDALVKRTLHPDA